jgi:hypothetical protein
LELRELVGEVHDVEKRGLIAAEHLKCSSVVKAHEKLDSSWTWVGGGWASSRRMWPGWHMRKRRGNT